MNYKKYITSEEKARAICLGYFDGIHLGHQKLVKKVVEEAKKYNLTPTFFTFDPNPNFALGFKDKNEIIQPLEERFEFVRNLGIEDIIVINFDEITKNMDPKDFVKFLIEELNVKNITVGFDFSYGKKGQGKVSDLLKLEPEIKINVIEQFTYKGEKISSSTIIEDIKNGRVSEIINTLGRYYVVKGKVKKGLGNGHKFGFPTLNLDFSNSVCIPKKGVYYVRVKIQDKYYKGMANVGIHPSIDSLEKEIVEVNVFDFDHNVYDEIIDVEFLEFKRDEMKFESIEKLIAQLKVDKREIIANWRW